MNRLVLFRYADKSNIRKKIKHGIPLFLKEKKIPE